MNRAAPAETHNEPHGIIRPARTADCDTVRRIARAAYARYLPRMDREPAPMNEDYEALARDGVLQVLETEQGLVGFIVLLPEENSMLLDNVAVAPEVQSKGHGKRLLDFAETAARAAGVAELRLYTNEVMVENITLYARLGFIEIDRAEQEGFRRVFMSKKL